MLKSLHTILLLFALLSVSYCSREHHETKLDDREDKITKFLEDELSKQIYEQEIENKIENDEEDIEIIEDEDNDGETENDRETEDNLSESTQKNDENDEGPSLTEELEDEEDQMIHREKRDPWRRFRFRSPRIRIRVPRIRLPRIRLPRIRLPRIRLPRIRLPRIRLRRIRLRLRRICVNAKLCKPKLPNCPSESQIISSITSMRCDPAWKNFFEPAYKHFVDSYFTEICQKHNVCASCANKAPWNRNTCEGKLQKQLTTLCQDLSSQQDSDAERTETLQWCKGKVTKITNYSRTKSHGGLNYCPCLPDDFNSD